jgi:hypothetical protein
MKLADFGLARSVALDETDGILIEKYFKNRNNPSSNRICSHQMV